MWLKKKPAKALTIHRLLNRCSMQHYLCGLIIGLLIMPNASTAQVRQTNTYTGTAIDQTTKAKIFVAKFTEKRVNGKIESIETVYFAPDGKEKIATRKVVYKDSPYAPNFVFQNLRNNSTEILSTVGNTAELHYKKSGSQNPLKKKLTVPSPMVADAGLVEFILAKWTNLKAGKRELINIVVTSRLDYYNFALYEKTPESEAKAGLTRIYFVSNHWFIRKLVSPIIMVFDNTTKQLVRFEGTTNLTNENGELFMKAIITYQFDKQ